MRKANVYYNGMLAGELTETTEREYIFRYNDAYFKVRQCRYQPDIAQSSRNTALDFCSRSFNMLSKEVTASLNRVLRIDEKDHLVFYWPRHSMIRPEP